MDKKKLNRKPVPGKSHNYLIFSLAILIAATLLAYSNTFRVPFHFDDEVMIEKRAEVRDMSSFSRASFWLNVNNRPLSFFSFALNHQAGGFSVTGYHVVNFMIHLLAGIVVFFLSRLLFRLARPGAGNEPRRGDLPALFIALIFLLHPLQTMGVTYTVQRMTSMAALFYLLSAFLYIHGRLAFVRQAWSKKSILLVSLAVFSGLLAILSKQSAATLPVAILLIEFYFIRKPDGKPYRRYLVTAASLLLIVFVVIALSGYLPKETANISRSEYLISQFKVLLHYFRMLFLPYGQNVDHAIPVSASFGIMEILGLLLFLGLAGLAVMTYRKQPLISFGIFWFFICMAVESSIIPIRDLMMEHRLYLPMFGFALVIVTSIDYLLRKQKAMLLSLSMGAICLVLMIITHSRNEVWKSPVSLWINSLEQLPDNARALGNLGYAYVREKNYDKAMEAYNRSIELDSTIDVNYMNRGIAYFDLGKYEQAIRDFNRYISHDQEADGPYFFRGVSYAHLNQNSLAISDLDHAIALNPGFAETYRNRSIVHQRMRNLPAALADINKAIELDPENKSQLVNRSSIYYMIGEYRKALQDVNEARKSGLRLDPAFVQEIENKAR